MSKDRNKWSKEETSELIKLCKTYGPAEGSRKMSAKSGRSAKACEQKWYTSKSHTKVVAKNLPKIVYHNGISQEARIIVKTDSLIVAKCDGDVVITVEL